MDRVCYTRGNLVINAPNDLAPTGIQLSPNANTIWIDGSSTMETLPTPRDSGTWFYDAARACSDETYGLLRHTYLFADLKIVCEALRKGDWVIVSDGSFSLQAQKGTAVIIIEDSKGTPLIKTYVLTSGHKDDMSAYRSELIGIYVGLLILKLFVEHLNLHRKRVVVGCDNEKAVQLGLQSTSFSLVTVKHLDILWEIQSLRQKSNMIIESRHVYGHQSEEGRAKCQLAHMSHEADGIAKWYLRLCIANPEITISQNLGGEHWSIWCSGDKIIGDVDSKLVSHIHGTQLKEHVASKKGWSKEQIQLVDWEAIRLVSKHSSLGDTLWRMKAASGFAPVATKTVLTKQWDCDSCPRCKTHIENLEHLVGWGHIGAHSVREKKMLDFCSEMAENNTDPFLIQTVMDTLRSQRSGRFQDHLPLGASSLLLQASNEQDALGRISIFQGYLTETWAKAQSEYWASLPNCKNNSIRQWKCMFLRGWYIFLRAQWDHRNDCVHNTMKESNKKKKAEAVNVQVQEQLDLGVSGLRSDDTHLIDDVEVMELYKK